MTEEMLKWANNALDHGGNFVRAFAEALLHADPDNIQIMGPAAGALMRKYPKYSEDWPN